MGACASSSRGRLNQEKNHKSTKVAAVPSSPIETGLQHQTINGKCSPPFAASPEMDQKSSFKWRIDGFSSLLAKKNGWTNSGYFEIKGLKWYLQLNLKDRKSGDEREYVSLLLVLSKTSDLKPNVIIEASFKLLIYGQAYGKHSEREFSHHFQTEESRSSGVSCMIPVETLKKPSSGFIVGDSCVFGVELIKLTTAKASHRSETVHVQKTNGFSAREVYNWDIDDFLALKKRCYSPEFEIGGHKWYLSMYPSGTDNSGEFLFLYLHMGKPDNAYQGSGVLVELSLSIKDQETGNHKKLTGRCQFSAKEKGDVRGWAKFMSLRRMGTL